MKKTLLLCVILCVFLVGCWDKVDLNDRAFVITLGLDKYNEKMSAEKKSDDKKIESTIHSLSGTDKIFLISAAIPDVKALDGGSEGTTKYIKKAAASTVTQALGISDSFSSQKMYYGHTKVAIWGEELLKDKNLLTQAIDSLEREPNISRKLSVFVTDKNAYEILEADSSGEPLVGLFISHYLKNTVNSGSIIFKDDLENFIIALRESGNAIVPKISIEGKDIKMGGSAVIKDYTLVGYLNDTETRGYLWVTGNVSGTIVETKYNDSTAAFTVESIKKDINFVEENDKIKVNIDLTVKGNISEYIFNKPFENVTELQFLLADKIKSEISQTFNKFKEQYVVDGFGFKKMLKRKNNSLYLKCKDNWLEANQKAEVNITCKVIINTVGVVK